MSSAKADAKTDIIPSIDSRYLAANAEKSARIQSRQLVQITFTAMLSALIGVLLSEKVDITHIHDYQAFFLSFGVAVFGLLVAAWVGHHDYLVGLLDSYCKALEEFGKRHAPKGTELAPCWHDTEMCWISKGFACRFWANNAFGVVLTATAIPNTLVLYANGHRQLALRLLCGVFVSVFLLRNFLLPPLRIADVRDIRRKYHVASILMLLIAAFISYVMWSVHDHPHINDNLTYWEWIGYSSFGVTVSCLALFIFFERKRILVLGGSYFDSKEGQFKVDSSRLSPPPLIGWLVWMYHLVQRRSLDR